MLETRPPDSPGRLIGLVLASLLLLLDVGLLSLLFGRPVSLLSFLWGLAIILSVPAILLIGAFALGLRRARYYLEGSTLLIEWGLWRHVIAIDDIQALLLGHDVRFEAFRGLRWPGAMVGWGTLYRPEGSSRPAVVYATRPPAEQLFVVTGNLAFGLSPADPEEFKSALEALQPITLSPQLDPSYATRLGPLDWPVWRDRPAMAGMGLAFLLNGLLFAFLAAIVGFLPAEVPLHFGASGTPDRLGAPLGLFILPLIGFLSWLLGVLLGWYFYHVRAEKPVAAVVWGATLWIQIAAWIAAAGLLV